MHTPRRLNLEFALLALAALTMVAALALLTAPGWFARLQADDYCAGGNMRQFGFWGSQWQSYQTWSGRVSATFFTNLLLLLAPGITRVLPFLMAGLLALALTAVFRLRLNLSRPAMIGALLLGSAAAFFTLLAAPNRYQVLFWLTGAATYTLPLILLAVLAAALLAGLRHDPGSPALRRSALLVGLLSALAAAFSETNAALHTGFFMLAGAACAGLLRGAPRRSGLRLSAAGLVGALTGMLALLFAPGNAVRMAQHPVTPPPSELIRQSFVYAADFTGATLRALPLPLLACLGLSLAAGFVLAERKPAPIFPWKSLLLLPAAYLLVVCATAPSVYAQSAYPEGRAQLGSALVWISAFIQVGLDGGAWLRTRLPDKAWLTTAAAMSLLLAGLYGLRLAIVIAPEQMNEQRAAAAARDARAARMDAAIERGERTVTVAPLDSIAGLMELGADPTAWVNQCAARYYGLDALQTEP